MPDATPASNKVILAVTAAQIRALQHYRQTAGHRPGYPPNARTEEQLAKLRLLETKGKDYWSGYRITRTGRAFLALLKRMRVAAV
jgi:hypothetical protein